MQGKYYYIFICVCISCSVISDSAAPRIVALQDRPAMGFPPGYNTGVCSHFLFQGIFPTQELNAGLLHCRQILYCLSHLGRTCQQDNITPNMQQATPVTGSPSISLFTFYPRISSRPRTIPQKGNIGLTKSIILLSESKGLLLFFSQWTLPLVLRRTLKFHRFWSYHWIKQVIEAKLQNCLCHHLNQQDSLFCWGVEAKASSLLGHSVKWIGAT